LSSPPDPPIAISAGFVPSLPGTYRWVAEYSGDANTAPATTACNDPMETVQVQLMPTVTITKTPMPTSRPEPGGRFDFTVVVTNTSTTPLTITSLVDDIYGDLNGKGTCAIGATMAANGGTYTCTFPGDFFGNAGQTQTDTVTVIGRNPFNQTATANARATVTLTNVAPSITITKTPNPTERPEPGGTFTFSVVVTNTSPEPLRIVSLVDDIYGNLDGKGTCDITPPPLLAANGGTYSCSFDGQFTGRAGDSQTDTVTVIGEDDEGTRVTASAKATVRLTGVAPTVAITKTPDPSVRPEPGGTFRFTVVVTNTSNEPVTIQSLVDDIYGNLDDKGTCQTGGTLAAAPGPGNTYTCAFDGDFRGAGGASQTDTVTVVVVDDQGQTATAAAQATVRLTSVTPLPRTGGGFSGQGQLAAALIVLGLLMVGASWRSPYRFSLVGVPNRRRPWPPEPPEPPTGLFGLGLGPRPGSGSGGSGPAGLTAGMGVSGGHTTRHQRPGTPRIL
ncbi:MAG: hypothetical protein ACRD12_01150, partial [Acidimicrobiales bacterium]